MANSQLSNRQTTANDVKQPQNERTGERVNGDHGGTGIPVLYLVPPQQNEESTVGTGLGDVVRESD